jgi:hypothetical protein
VERLAFEVRTTPGNIMKSTAFVALAGIAAAIFSIAAQAQTGRPSVQEVPAAADTPHAVAGDQELGSYARYLMLNGATRENALVAAHNVDAPAESAGARRLAAANRAASRANAQDRARQ